ncbi:ribosomal protein S18-alanine N-acetyltransferase [Methanolobus sp. ZRKC3]|uniref:ribosomal protein S18-alanine N-acetyltransferase n=1 Tax=Methanolobus sp. ZRKC3 TaxID=3125786 RepID=UPI00324B7EB2
MIRRAEAKDIPEIVKIEDSSFGMPWPDFMFKAHLSNPGFVVYESEGRVLGYAMVGDEDGIAHLMSIAVDPKYRRQEVGSKLLEWCLDTLVMYGYHKVSLEVRVSNVAAQEFYLARGFKKEKIVEAYYIDEDAIVMGREF